MTFNGATPNTSHRASAAQFMLQMSKTRQQSFLSTMMKFYFAAVTRTSYCGFWGRRSLMVGEVCC